jgi:AbrB family looped-hinge helix DNA binding protein
MDRAGRVVLPKSLRDQLGLEPDEELDVSVDGSGIRLQPRTKPERVVVSVDGWPVIGAGGSRATTDADVRSLRDAAQR